MYSVCTDAQRAHGVRNVHGCVRDAVRFAGAPAARSAPQADLLGDLLGGGVSAKPAAAAKPVLLPAQRGKGLTISGCFARRVCAAVFAVFLRFAVNVDCGGRIGHVCLY